MAKMRWSDRTSTFFSGKRAHELRNLKTNQTAALMENTNALDMLERHPDKVSGAWVFKGARVPVSALFENLKDGASKDIASVVV